MATEVKLPELGENIEEGEVTRLLVSIGDTVDMDQPLVEMETGKATLEVPSDAAGTVKEIRVQEGDKVPVGAVIVVLEGGTPEAPAPEPEEAAAEPTAAPAAEPPCRT